ncbi:TRAP transporter substrate-binding protein DctP [Paralimibaculum aggregatum]|uniref:TRAP transporter substrate-binding protein DctP n=1 Tax=Paralimibaculum aggregatum TaxID=3036245 RepID=A0ABQ6LRE3_9RHOB|nr:TRAP transporter substrate-binding protein [Limibaculum sp. NKW23]GMG84583.1 TRAP transporter substrate-binding protein DctP [Limibaculum sp. NKW23]
MRANRRTLLGLAAAAALAAAGGVQAQETTELKIQSIWQAGSINQQVFERFAENVGKASGGRLTVTPLPVGAVVAYNETLEAVGSGILEGQHSAPAYFAGREPGMALLADLNAAYENPYQLTDWVYEHGGLEIAREMYADFNLFYVGPVLWGMESIPSKKRVATVEDFQGMKLRMPEGTASEIFRNIGAAPVNIPGAEVYTSLERGVIDGADWGTLSMNQDLGFHKIAPYPIYPGLHSMPMGEVAINLDTWNGLPDDLKTIFEMAVRDFNYDMIRTMASADLEAVAAARADGAELVDWSDEERRKLRRVAAEVWREFGGRSEMAGKVVDSHVAYLKSLGLIE